jgi:predicted kinase
VKESSIDQARRYFDLAYRYAGGKVRPRLVIMCGLSGTGKTHVADALAAEFDLVVIQSDIVRKHLAGLKLGERRTVAYETGIYSEDMTEQTYRAMADDAEQLLAAGHSLILDASFLRRWQRGIAQAVAAAADARLLVVHCTAPEEDVKARLEARQEEKSISDATWEIYQRQKKTFEPPDEIESSELIVVDTTQDLDAAVETVGERLASGEEVLEQVG